MTPKWKKLVGRLLVGVFVSLAFAGCSSDQPMAPTSTPGDANYAVTPGDQVQFAARVATTSQLRQMLTFVGKPDTVIAAQNCQIVRLNNGQDTPIPFSEIHPGDSIDVRGTRQQNQNVIANRLQLCSGDQVQFVARVRTMDQNRLMLTFVGQPDTVVAAHNCQIVRLNNGQDTPIPFSEIHPGDSIAVNGYHQQVMKVIANRLQLCQDGAGSYDVAFRDTILAIDYANNSFTVKGRTEVITVDANTVIWGQLPYSQGPNALSGGGDNVRHRYDYEYGGDKKGQRDTTLVLSDLAVGDVVEVKANIVDPATLLAVTIKVANCGETACLTFNSYLASVDIAAKTVTFTDQTWIGWVGNGAKLTGLSDEALNLADFAAGDYVSVKGYATAGDTLKICQMSKEAI